MQQEGLWLDSVGPAGGGGHQGWGSRAARLGRPAAGGGRGRWFPAGCPGGALLGTHYTGAWRVQVATGSAHLGAPSPSHWAWSWGRGPCQIHVPPTPTQSHLRLRVPSPPNHHHHHSHVLQTVRCAQHPLLSHQEAAAHVRAVHLHRCHVGPLVGLGLAATQDPAPGLCRWVQAGGREDSTGDGSPALRGPLRPPQPPSDLEFHHWSPHPRVINSAAWGNRE